VRGLYGFPAKIHDQYLGIRTEFWFRPATDQGVLMPGLLISVQNASEARIALAGGCDVLDVKNPAAGSLGQPTFGSLADILTTVEQSQHAIPVSCALGELRDWATQPEWWSLLNRLDYIKIGPAGLCQFEEWAARFSAVQAEFRARGVSRPRWIAAFYLDHLAAGSFDPLTTLHETILRKQIRDRLGCAGVLLDTFDKQGPAAAELVSQTGRTRTLREWLAKSQSLGLLTAFAGRLTIKEIQNLQAEQIQPELFAVRSAVCRENDRQAELEPDRIRRLSELIRSFKTPAPLTAGPPQVCHAD